MIEIELPYPPSINHYKKIGRLVRTKTGKMYQVRANTNDTKIFYFDVLAKISHLKCHKGLKSFQGSTISVEVLLHPPDARKRDIDNPIKPILDSLQRAGLFDDDYQIACLLVRRMIIIPKGKVIVRITEIEDAHQRS